jgi:hypothetical protein
MCSVSINNAASSKSKLHVDEMHINVIKGNRKVVVYKLYHTALLPDAVRVF